MFDLSRRAVFLNVAGAAIWARSASEDEGRADPSQDVRHLMAEVCLLTARFYRTALERTPFADAQVRRYARDLAADHVARAGDLAGPEHTGRLARGTWSPALDQVVAATGRGGRFAPFAGDAEFLLAAHALESACADTFRLGARAGPALATLTAEATYHAGLVRTAMAATSAGRVAAPAAQAVTELFAELRATPGLNDDPARRALRTLFLTATPSSRGGFFPLGLQGPVRLSA